MSDRFLKYVAYLQIIGIILVVLGHSFHEYPDGDMGRTTVLYRMIYSIMLPLFMFVSGFLMIFTTRICVKSPAVTVTSFVKKKILRLLLPFIVLTLVIFVPRALLSGYADDVVELSADNFFRSFIHINDMPVPYLWFLQASFILLVFSYTFITLGEKAHISNILLYSVLILLFLFLRYIPAGIGDTFSLNKVFELGIYFVLGATFARFAAHIDRYLPWASLTFLGATAIVWAVLFFMTEGTAFDILCSVAGITMCVSLSKILEAHDIRIIDHLIGATYLIFLLSWFCNVASQQVLSHFVRLPWWCYSILSLVSGIYVPWLCYVYLCRHPDSRWVKVTAFLLGQSLRKKLRR